MPLARGMAVGGRCWAGVRLGGMSGNVPDRETFDHGDIVTGEGGKEVGKEHIKGEAGGMWVLTVGSGAEGDGGVHAAEPLSERRRAEPAERVADEG